jgi:hypothetical protein
VAGSDKLGWNCMFGQSASPIMLMLCKSLSTQSGSVFKWGWWFCA